MMKNNKHFFKDFLKSDNSVGVAEVSNNLARYRFENNFIGLFKIII